MDAWLDIVLDFILDTFKWGFDFLRSIEFYGINMLLLMVIFIVIGFIVNAFINNANGLYSSIRNPREKQKAPARRKEYYSYLDKKYGGK